MNKFLTKMAWLGILFMVTANMVEAGPGQLSIALEDQSRGYFLYVPSSYSNSDSVPLVIVLHGRGGTGKGVATLSEFNPRADKQNFIVVYPDGIEGTWFYPRGIGGFGEKPNDTEFLLALIQKLKGEYRIDSNRIYVTGISNGGFMAQRIACDAPDQIAAAASVAASGFAGMDTACRSKVPIPIMFFHGTADNLVPWDGRKVKHPNGIIEVVTFSVRNTLNFWSYYNGCKGTLRDRKIPKQDTAASTGVRVLSTHVCNGGSEVVLYSILGGGHNWPGVKGIIPDNIAGRINMDIHASDEIWTFFERHRRN